MEKYIYLIIGLVVGALLIYLWLKQQFSAQNATFKAQTKHAQEVQDNLQTQMEVLHSQNEILKEDVSRFKVNIKEEEVENDGLKKEYQNLEVRFNKLEADFTAKTDGYNKINNELAKANAVNKYLQEKLSIQKEEMDAMGKKFSTEFENIAGKILKENTKTFSELNQTKIKELLNPLGENIKEFKQKVQDVYDKEAKERFSLGEKVKELAEKSDKISQDAINLTNAYHMHSSISWGQYKN